jgi:hypothetical protein
MGQRSHSKEVVEMVKEHEENTFEGWKHDWMWFFFITLAFFKGAENTKNLGT